MKLFTILRNLIQGIKSAVTESKDYTDSAITPIDARLTEVEKLGTLVDSQWVQGTSSLTIPAPSTWRWMLVSVFRVQGSNEITYQTIVSNKQTFSSNGVIVLGGYYLSSGDYGLCNVNITLTSSGGSINIRNFYYGGNNGTSTAQMVIRLFA